MLRSASLAFGRTRPPNFEAFATPRRHQPFGDLVVQHRPVHLHALAEVQQQPNRLDRRLSRVHHRVLSLLAGLGSRVPFGASNTARVIPGAWTGDAWRRTRTNVLCSQRSGITARPWSSADPHGRLRSRVTARVGERRFCRSRSRRRTSAAPVGAFVSSWSVPPLGASHRRIQPAGVKAACGVAPRWPTASLDPDQLHSCSAPTRGGSAEWPVRTRSAGRPQTA